MYFLLVFFLFTYSYFSIHIIAKLDYIVYSILCSSKINTVLYFYQAFLENNFE